MEKLKNFMKEFYKLLKLVKDEWKSLEPEEILTMYYYLSKTRYVGLLKFGGIALIGGGVWIFIRNKYDITINVRERKNLISPSNKRK